MNLPRFERLVLDLRLRCSRFGLVNSLVCLVWIVAGFAYLWGLPHLHAITKDQHRVLVNMKKSLQDATDVQYMPPRSAAEDRLTAFYDALGETRYAEQQIKVLFGIAAKQGLTLNAAEYKFNENKDGKFHTYQVTLPIKGPYVAIRQFCEQTLVTIPFSSLDDINFKRDAIASPMLEARVHFTLYFTEKTVTPAQRSERTLQDSSL